MSSHDHSLAVHDYFPGAPTFRKFPGILAVMIASVVCIPSFAGTPGLVNADFDANLTGWILSGPPFPAWSMLDYLGNPNSGSAELRNDSSQPNIRLYPLHQCVALFGPGTYAIEADGFLPAGHVGGRFIVSFSSRAIPDCSGGINGAGGYFLQSNGAWTHQSANIIVNPGFTYLDVSLGIEKDDGGRLLIGNIDAVHVINRERIFSNGFEAPDLP